MSPGVTSLPPASSSRSARAAGMSALDRFDHAVADADVAPAAQALAGIEHVAALDDEIELVVRPHGGARRAGDRECAGGDEKIAS